MQIGKVLSKRTLISPHRQALIYEDKIFTYQELEQRTNRLAQALLEHSIHPGDRVALLMNNSNEFVEVFFACARIGVILIPLNVRLAAPELDYIIKDCEVTALIYGEEFTETVTQLKTLDGLSLRVCTAVILPPDCLNYENFIAGMAPEDPGIEIQEDDLMVIMYTSGTTGHPKGAMLSHHNIYRGAINLMTGIHYTYPDTSMMLVPLFHSGGNTPLVGHFIRGISTVLMRRFDPLHALQLIERYKVRMMMGVTSIMTMILAVPGYGDFNLKKWEMAVLPGSPLPHSLIKTAYERFGVLCQNLWGMTEISGPGSLMNIEEILDRPECAGKPYFEVDIRIVDIYGMDQPANELGEVIVRGPNVMKGYWRQPEASTRSIQDGWLYSGDIGYLDENNYLYIVDRKKDMIVSGGENVYPMEIESVLADMPGIAEVAVIGIPDEKWGEIPKAFIVPFEGQSPVAEQIIVYCRQRLAGYKVPKQIEIIDQLPRNASGKVLKKNLR